MAVIIEGTPEGYVVAKPSGEIRPHTYWVDDIAAGPVVFSRAEEIAEMLNEDQPGHRIYALIRADV